MRIPTPSRRPEKASGEHSAAQPLGARPARLAAPSTANRWSNGDLLVVGGLGIGYFATRLIQISLAGLYYDEAVYLYWAKIIGSDWGQRFIGAGAGGKQPLHSWLIAVSARVFADPILAGRLVSVATGFATLAAVWLIASRLFSRRVAMLASLLYIVVPFTFLFDRRALADSLLAAEAAWTLFLSLLLVRRQSPLTVAGLALVLGSAMLTKSVGQALLFMLPAALITADRKALTPARIIRWAVAAGLAALGGYIIYYSLFGWDPAAGLIDLFERQREYTRRLPELLLFPWGGWLKNAGSVVSFLADLLTIPLTIAGAGALVWSLREKNAKAVFLGLWAIVPMLGQIVLVNLMFDRYLLFSIPPLLILIAFALDQMYAGAKERIAGKGAGDGKPMLGAASGIVLALLLVPSVTVIIRELTDQHAANKANSGFLGLVAVRDYFDEKSKSGSLYVLVNPDLAPVADGAAALLYDNPNAVVLRAAPLPDGFEAVDPVNRKTYVDEFFRNKDVYYVSPEDFVTPGWLANCIDQIESFSNRREIPSSIGIYRIHYDGECQ